MRQSENGAEARADPYRPCAACCARQPSPRRRRDSPMACSRRDRTTASCRTAAFNGSARCGSTTGTAGTTRSCTKRTGHSSGCRGVSPPVIRERCRRRTWGEIRPTEVGFASVRLDPCAIEMEHAEVAVPTPHGIIRCQWRRGEPGTLHAEIDLPAPVTATVPMGTGTARLQAGRHSVTLGQT